MLEFAQQASVLHSSLKDNIQINHIRSSLSNIVQALFGNRYWIKWQNELHLLSDVGYFALTTFAGLQTMGEEYVNILLVTHGRRSTPSTWRRGMMIVLQTVLPYSVTRCLSLLEQRLQRDEGVSPEVRTRLLHAIPIIRHVITVMHRCHLAAFYMNGLFYHMAKRLMRIYYVMVRKQTSNTSTRSYHILGWLALTQLLLTLAQQCYQPGTSQTHISSLHPVNKEQTEASTGSKCSLCLEPYRHSTATPCGHLFCWHCITQWCQEKMQCPLCWQKISPSHLIYLHNYV